LDDSRSESLGSCGMDDIARSRECLHVPYASLRTCDTSFRTNDLE